MDIRRILYAVVRKWWIIAITVSLFGGAGYYINIVLAPTIYRTDTTLYVLNRSKIDEGQSLSTSDLILSQSFVKQYSGIFDSRTVNQATARRLSGYNISEQMIPAMVQMSNQKDSNLLTIKATAPDPKMAADIANAMAEEFILQIRLITKSDFIGVLDEAQVPERPASNNGFIKTIIFIFGGLIIALGIIYLIEYFDTTVRSAEEVEELLNMRVIGIIPEHDIR